ncbi:hypothetical protein HQ545_03120 [Candidatus Woesearchaeota archaeon]|nr:hypothetical protein [Candidatus Woesearchaeota archaeon]
MKYDVIVVGSGPAKDNNRNRVRDFTDCDTPKAYSSTNNVSFDNCGTGRHKQIQNKMTNTAR